MFDNLLVGINFIANPMNFLLVVAGVIMGVIVGALPGLGCQAGVAILIPVTFWMKPDQAIAMLGAVYAAGVAGGSITSILFRIPGESASAAVIFDGFPMAKQGKAGRALGLAMTASAIGGTFSAIVLMTVAPQLAKVALKFDQAEYFALCIFGMSTVTSLGAKNQLKALISTFIGLFVVTVGMSAVTGVERFTFGSERLRYGVSYVPVIVGLFGFSEFLRNTATEVFKDLGIKGIKATTTKTQIGVIREFFHMKATMIRSILLGTFIGTLPGTGSTASSILAYNEAVRWSKHPEKFGTGLDEGVAAPEFANNAATGGALIPTLALGIPGSSTTAVILAALMSHGIMPGPNLFLFKSDLVWGVFAGFLTANVIMIIFGMLGIWVFAKILTVPRSIMNASIFLLCIIGAYGINNNLLDVWIMFIFGFLGYAMEKYGFPLTPLVLGIILGPIAEKSLYTGMTIYGSFLPFLTRPIGGTLLFLAILSSFYPTIRNIIERRKRVASVQ
jgi:putative tricarboxylic transport membrane protein